MVRRIFSRGRFLGLGLVLGLALGPTSVWGQSQAWERLLAPGLTYRMELDLALPRVIHALRYTPGVELVTSRPELAGGVVFEPEDDTRGRETLTQTMSRMGAIAGVNADFFPWTGDPLGAMVRNGELVSTPYPGRSVFAWGPGYTFGGVVGFQGSFTDGVGRVALDAVNEEAGPRTAVLFTPAAGFAVARQASTFVVLETSGILRSGEVLEARVAEILTGQTRMRVEAGRMILVADGEKASVVGAMGRGANVQVRATLTGLDSGKGVNVVGGGPKLVTGGRVSVASQSERFSVDFTNTLHPRTAIGVTAAGDMWLVVIDGRQPMSRGASLDETARVMQRLGCVEAVNLDGGGSSTLAVGGLVLNRPSGGSQRAISNSILLFGTLPAAAEGSAIVIRGVPRIRQGENTSYALVDEKGERVPAQEILWSAQGAAWIDQSGFLRTHGSGRAVVSARARGLVATVEVTVEPRTAPAQAAATGGGARRGR